MNPYLQLLYYKRLFEEGTTQTEAGPVAQMTMEEYQAKFGKNPFAS